jgi:hypothetical protein
MATINDYLVEVKNKLSIIGGVKTLKIGMEKGIGAKDCPFIRIVPEMNIPSETRQCLEGGMEDLTFEIIFGFDIKNNDLEADLYPAYYQLEKDIKTALVQGRYSFGSCNFLHTVTDEDKLMNIKTAISRFELVGIKV